MNNIYKANTELITDKIKSVTINSFAFYIKAKLLFKNSTIYKKKTSTREMSKLFGCSHTVIKKYLNELNDAGLITYMNGNITFRSLKHSKYFLSNRNTIHLRIYKTDSLNAIVAKLKFSILKLNGNKQKFIINAKADLNKRKMDLKVYKKYIKGLSEKQRVINEDLNIGNKKLGELLYCSKQTVSRLKHIWAELNLVRFKRVFENLGPINKNYLKYGNNISGVFISNKGIGYRYKHSKFEYLAGGTIYNPITKTYLA